MFRLYAGGELVALGTHFGDMHVLSKAGRHAGHDISIVDERTDSEAYSRPARTRLNA